jgi:hypothetical protein
VHPQKRRVTTVNVGERKRRHTMLFPDYVKILKLDKLALKSKTREDFLKLAESRLPYAKNLGVADSFPFFVERAWETCGDGK